MSTSIPPIRSLLEAGRRQSDQYHYAKFRLVVADPNVAQGSQNASYLAWLATLSAEAVLKSASPFLWLSVHRLFRRIANDDFGSEFLGEVDALLLTSFDCLSSEAENRHVTLVHRTGNSLVLPCNGIQFEGGGGRVRLRRESNEISAADPESGERLYLSGGSSVREALWSGAYVLHAKNEELFEAFYLHEVTGAAEKCLGYRDRVLAALTEIQAVDPALAQSIMSEVRWFVPIGTTLDEHYFSFTSAMLKDVLFISLHQGADDLVEAIIHEYHHGALNYFMDTIPVFDASDEAVFYSPWKTEPRPLSGLFHGLFVFSACLEYYMRADTAAVTPRGRYRLARATDIFHKLTLADRQVPRNVLTREGVAIAEACDRVRAAALLHWSSLSDGPPAYIAEHAREWQDRNPALVVQN